MCVTSYHDNAFSDHYYMLIRSISQDDRGIKPFKFFNIRPEYPDYKVLLTRVWNMRFEGSAMNILDCKLFRLNKLLKNFNIGVFRDMLIVIGRLLSSFLRLDSYFIKNLLILI